MSHFIQLTLTNRRPIMVRSCAITTVVEAEPPHPDEAVHDDYVPATCYVGGIGIVEDIGVLEPRDSILDLIDRAER